MMIYIVTHINNQLDISSGEENLKRKFPLF